MQNRSQTSPTIREMQIKILMNYLFTTITLENFKSGKEWIWRTEYLHMPLVEMYTAINGQNFGNA